MENVSIHAPREGCDDLEAITPLCRSKFQFTHPGRGATGKTATLTEDARRFNSRTPGGVRPTSPRAPSICRQRFNSRTPGGVRLRVRPILVRGLLGFNSRTPGGVRPVKKSDRRLSTKFQFTHPGRGATVVAREVHLDTNDVSIHAPREGCDARSSDTRARAIRFQFTHPGRGATWSTRPRIWLLSVSIHAPRRGATEIARLLQEWEVVSIHAPREGCDSRFALISLDDSRFQFTHPGRGATSPIITTHRSS